MAGSDAPYHPNVGRAYTEVVLDSQPELRATADATVEAIRDGDTEVRGRRTPISANARHYATGAVKKGTYAFTSRAPFVPTWPTYGHT